MWCLAIVSVPLLATSDILFARQSSSFLQECFSHVCHRLPDRSFHLWGEPLGVCVRCSSIYGGFLVGLIVYPLLKRRAKWKVPARSYLVIAALPTAADALLNILGLVPSTELSRAITGALLGMALAVYLLPLLLEAYVTMPGAWRARRTLQMENGIWKNDRTRSASPSSPGRSSGPSLEFPDSI